MILVNQYTLSDSAATETMICYRSANLDFLFEYGSIPSFMGQTKVRPVDMGNYQQPVETPPECLCSQALRNVRAVSMTSVPS